MLTFCTLFDSNYLSRGLTLYYSLLRVCPDFRLIVFAFDDVCFDVLTKMELKNLFVIPLKDFENDKLLIVKPTRSRGEYCWTCTSWTILYVLENFEVESCTYLDADLFFFGDPKILLDEVPINKSILLTEHRYTRETKSLLLNGKYCVQFLMIKNDENGLKALRWWTNECIKWCYARYEDGKFGDQKYLEDWLTRFEGVYELENIGGGVAPWNVQQYKIINNIKSVRGIQKKTNKEFKLVFYHFHLLKFYSSSVYLGHYLLSKEVINIIYKSYIKSNLEIQSELLKSYNLLGCESLHQPRSLINFLRFLKRYLFGNLNQLNLKQFSK